jgi:hypothetical protein
MINPPHYTSYDDPEGYTSTAQMAARARKSRPGPDPKSTVGALWVIPIVLGVPIGLIFLAVGGSSGAIGVLVAAVVLAFLFAAINTPYKGSHRTASTHSHAVKRLTSVTHKPRPFGAL